MSGGNAAGASADDLIGILRSLALPPLAIERATAVPHDRARRENDAEHSFSLGIAALCIAPLMDDGLNVPLLCAYALVHDLDEIYAGDTPVYASAGQLAAKAARTGDARARLRREHGARHPWLVRYLDGYAALEDPESRFLYALDKAITHATVIIGGHHPAMPTMTAYKETERVAREKIEAACPALTPLFDELCRRYVRLPIFTTEPDDGRG